MKGCIGETKRTGVLWLTAAISRNFFYIFLIRDFSRKRTSKEQYPSVIVFLSFLAMAFYEGGVWGEQHSDDRAQIKTQHIAISKENNQKQTQYFVFCY